MNGCVVVLAAGCIKPQHPFGRTSGRVSKQQDLMPVIPWQRLCGSCKYRDENLLFVMIKAKQSDGGHLFHLTQEETV